jgi:hypothetical protein
LIGDNLPPFEALFQGLNIDLNQKRTTMLTMFNRGEIGKNHVNNMCMQRWVWLSIARENINRSDLI